MNRLRRSATRRIMRAEARIIRTLEGETKMPLMREPYDYTKARAGQPPPEPVGCLPHFLLAVALVGVLVVAAFF